MAASSKHALIVGGSSGIGLAVAKEIAPVLAKLTLCSRSLPKDLLASIRAKNPDIEVVHEKLDVSLLHEVRKFTVKHADTQLDWVVLTPGILTMSGRTETYEGLDVKMSTYYYGRFMLVHDLLAGLNRPGVRVLNVLGINRGSAPDLDDLDLKRTFSPQRCSAATTIYSDLMAQALSEHAPLASFMHVNPGFVNTGVFDDFAWYLRLPGQALAAVVARSPEKSATYMVSALTNDEFAAGWKLLGPNAEEVAKTKYQTDALKDAVWKHTLQTIEHVMKV